MDMKKKIITFWVLVILLGLSILISDLISKPKDVNNSIQFEAKKQEESKYKIIGYSLFYEDGHDVFSSYDGSHKLPDVDLSTFIPLGNFVGKDKNHVYVEDRTQPSLDAKSFVKYDINIGQYYRFYPEFFTDKNGLYYLANENGNDKWVIKLSPLDPNEGEIIGSYLKYENGVYWIGQSNIIKVDGIDFATFRVLGTCMEVEMFSESYMIDKNHIYVGTAILKDADSQTFKQIANIESGEDSELPYLLTLWKDKNHIYAHCGKIITEADYATFEYLGNNKAQDKNNLYSLHTGGGYYVTPRK